MGLSLDKRVWITTGIIFVVLCIIVSLLFYFNILFVIFIIGSLIILITEKTHQKFNKFMKKIKIPENKSIKTVFTIITILFWIILLYVLISFTIKDINKTTEYMSEQNLTIGDIYLKKAISIFGEERIQSVEFKSILNELQSFLLKAGTNITKNFLVFFAASIIIIPLMFNTYFKQKKTIREDIYRTIPKKFKKGFKKIAEQSSHKMKDYAYAKILESTIIAIICAIGFKIAGLTGWLLFGLLCGILNIIPYLGPWMGAVGPILISLLSPNTSTFLITGITLIVAQAVDNFYIIPFLIPKQVSVHPLVSIILIIAGAQTFGALGMLMAIPIYEIFKIVLTGIYKELKLIYQSK